MQRTNKQQGGVLIIVAVAVLSVLTIVFGGLAIWSYTQYQAKSNDVEGQIKLAVSEGKAEQREADDKRFDEKEKEPNREFVGPADYGRLTFEYPKTWSLYEATDISRGGDYEAYLNPNKVPPVNNKQQFALRVLIENEDYDRVMQQYDSEIKKGALRSSFTTSQGNRGARLDGNFSKDIRGSAVVYKMRDKTITLRTDADVFKPDFEKIIQTISFDE